MKNIFKTLILAAGVVAMTGCSDYLEQTSPSEYTNGEVFGNNQTAEYAVNKLYGALTDATYANYVPIIFGAGTDCEFIDGLGEQAALTTSERGNMNYEFNGGWNTLNIAWKSMYDIIKYSNLAISGIEGSSIYNGADSEEKVKMRAKHGEALTIRAMVYLDLVRNWGDVPYIGVEQTLGDNVYFAKTDRDVILDKCIADLKMAKEELPWADEMPGYSTERVTKGYALGLLSQVALTRAGYAIREKQKEGYEMLGQDPTEPAELKQYCDVMFPTMRPSANERKEYYQIAADAAAELIKSDKHDLNPSFEDEWKLINQLKLDRNYHENLFETANGVGMTGEQGYTVGKRINGKTDFFGQKGNSSGKLKMSGQLWQSFHSTGYASNNAVECFQQLDTRRDVTISLFQWVQKTGFKYYNVTHSEELFYDDWAGKGPFAMYCGKWRPEWMPEQIRKVACSGGEAKWSTGINFVRMRYSQVLLNYAEAAYMLGGINNKEGGCEKTALEALEYVHTRAYAPENKELGKKFIDDLANEDFMGALIKENAWEFAGEGVRKYDLIRWGQLGHQIVVAKKEFIDGIKDQPSMGGYPRYFFYRLTQNPHANNLLQAEGSQYGFYGTEVYPTFPGDTKKSTKTDAQSQKWFAHGDNGGNDTNLRDNLPSICEGLNLWSEIEEAAAPYRTVTLFNTAKTNVGVRNRYILPIGNLTVSASNGTLQNSYGF